MLMVLSPAKTLDYDSPLITARATEPQLLDEAATLAALCKPLSPQALSSLMGISDKLAVLNVARFAHWQREATAQNSRPAILAFKGDVYTGLAVEDFTEADLDFAQAHLRILSGLYGVLRPLDRLQPYRLEMGTRLENGRGKDLYAFWGSRISDVLAGDMAGEPLINLASEEYFGAVKPALLPGEVISPVFQDEKSGKYKIISFHAKRARGLMARYIIKQRLTRPEQLLEFDLAGYAYCPELSTPQKPLFRRPASAA